MIYVKGKVVSVGQPKDNKGFKYRMLNLVDERDLLFQVKTTDLETNFKQNEEITLPVFVSYFDKDSKRFTNRGINISQIVK